MLKTLWDNFAADVHTTAASKGWWDNARNNGEIIALCHSELTELFDAFLDNANDDHLPELSGVACEAADTLIRIADVSHVRGWDVGMHLDAMVAEHAASVRTDFDTFEAFMSGGIVQRHAMNQAAVFFAILSAHKGLSDALECMRHDTDPSQYLAACVGSLHRLALYGYDIGEAMTAKAAYNKGRAYKHGGKNF